MRAAVIAVIFAACASADEVRPFPLNPEYTERRADPGVVNLACYQPGGHLDDGSLMQWNDSYCGCLVGNTVWIARHPKCDADLVRAEENCHIMLGPSKEARLFCHRAFK